MNKLNGLAPFPFFPTVQMTSDQSALAIYQALVQATNPWTANDTFARSNVRDPYQGTGKVLDRAQIGGLQIGRVIERSGAEMDRMYRKNGDLLPKGRYYEKLFDHGTGKPWRAGGDGTTILRTSGYPRTAEPTHRPVSIDVVDVSKVRALGLPDPQTRADVEQLKRTHPEVIQTVQTRTESDVAIKLAAGHEYVAMGPSGTMGMMASASQMTTADGVRW